MPIEVEAKFHAPDLDAVRERLIHLGFVSQGRKFEANRVLDSPDRRLFQAGDLLRLRSVGPAHTLTLKTKTEESDAAAAHGVKLVRETETRIENTDALLDVLAHLGFGEAFRYEKFRESFKGPDATVCLDELPFGRFVEIEAEAERIKELAAQLGLDPAAASAATYHDLHQTWRAERGLPSALSFVFAEAIL